MQLCSSFAQVACSPGRLHRCCRRSPSSPDGKRALGVGGSAAAHPPSFPADGANIAKVGKQWKYSGGNDETAQVSARARVGKAKILNASWDRNGDGIVCEFLPRGQYKVRVVSMEQLMENSIEEDELNKNNADLKVKFSPEGLLEIAGPFLRSDMTEISVESLEDVCNGLSSASSALSCPFPHAVDSADSEPLPFLSYSSVESPGEVGEIPLSGPSPGSANGSAHPIELSISGRPINRG